MIAEAERAAAEERDVMRAVQQAEYAGTVILSRFVGLFLLNLPCADKDDTVESRKCHPSGMVLFDEFCAWCAHQHIGDAALQDAAADSAVAEMTARRRRLRCLW